MTHPSPTTLPQAPSLLRQSQRAGISSLSAVLVFALFAAPAFAQIVPTGSPAADIVLSQALADQRVFLTCTALEPESHRLIIDFWQADVAAAVAFLTEKGVPPEAIAAFTAAADPAALALPPDTPFAEVVDYCQAQTHWFIRMNRRDFTELARALPEALP